MADRTAQADCGDREHARRVGCVLHREPGGRVRRLPELDGRLDRRVLGSPRPIEVAGGQGLRRDSRQGRQVQGRVERRRAVDRARPGPHAGIGRRLLSPVHRGGRPRPPHDSGRGSQRLRRGTAARCQCRPRREARRPDRDLRGRHPRGHGARPCRVRLRTRAPLAAGDREPTPFERERDRRIRWGLRSASSR